MTSADTNTSSHKPNPAVGEILLQLENISKTFGGVRALRGVSLSLRAGEIYHLLGENGSGKSTLIKIISGAQPPDAGSITVRGKTYSKLGALESLGGASFQVTNPNAAAGCGCGSSFGI